MFYGEILEHFGPMNQTGTFWTHESAVRLVQKRQRLCEEHRSRIFQV